MNYEDITNPKIKAIIDGMKYYSMSVETYVFQALDEAENEEDFIGDAKGFLNELCNEIQEVNQSLTEATNEEITIYVRGGVIQDITDIPEGIKVKTVDWDVDGVEEERLTKLEGGMALVAECTTCGGVTKCKKNNQ